MGIIGRIREVIAGGNTLYYPGCLSKFVLKSETENYKKILARLGIDFIMLPNELCCGSPALNAGYEKETRKLARKNLNVFKEHNIRKIITNCPACFKTFKQDYNEMLPDWDIEVEHVSVAILDKLRKKPGLIKNKKEGRVTYHDPCHLGRHSGIYEEPREILNILGFHVIEMRNSRENALCCGGGAGLRVNNPSLALKIGMERIEQAKKINAEKIITTCPLCFSHMSDKGVEVEEFSYSVAQALDIQALKTKETEFGGNACD
jgi:Fe-S oxidoreductase